MSTLTFRIKRSSHKVPHRSSKALKLVKHTSSYHEHLKRAPKSHRGAKLKSSYMEPTSDASSITMRKLRRIHHECTSLNNWLAVGSSEAWVLQALCWNPSAGWRGATDRVSPKGWLAPTSSSWEGPQTFAQPPSEGAAHHGGAACGQPPKRENSQGKSSIASPSQ